MDDPRERLFVVFTRLIAPRTDKLLNEFLSVWQQPADRTYWASERTSGRQILVVHAADYPGNEREAQQRVVAHLDGVLADAGAELPPADRRVLGIVLHTAAESIRRAIAAAAEHKLAFVCRYHNGHVAFSTLAPLATAHQPFEAEFDRLWEYYQHGNEARYRYECLGRIRHWITSAYAALMQDLQTWSDRRFSPEFADTIAVDYAHTTFPQPQEVHARFYGEDSVRDIVNSATLSLRLTERLEVLAERIIDDPSAPLPQHVAALLTHCRNASALRQWACLNPSPVPDVLAWWIGLLNDIDDLMAAFATARDKAPATR